MQASQQETAAQVATFAIALANCIVYLSFKGLAALSNTMAGREVLSRRWTGVLGVVLFTVAAAWYFRVHFVNQQVLASLPSFKQGEYIGEVMGPVTTSAILVLAVVGIRGWLASRKQSTERTQQAAASARARRR